MVSKARRSKAVDAYVKRLPRAQQPILGALRGFVFANARGFEENLNPWGNPVYHGNANVCWILAYRDHIDFGFFRGTDLPDPEPLLEGTGKRLRHVKIRSVEDVKRKALLRLLKAALKLDAA